MKTKIYTTVSTIMLFIPWGLLFLRRYDWALQMPMAKILISGCAALMIAGGVFSVIVYAIMQNAAIPTAHDLFRQERTQA